MAVSFVYLWWPFLINVHIDDILIFFSFCLFFVFLEEDRYDSYSRMILKYFLAEGVVCRHELFVSAVQESPDDILQVWACGLRHLKTLHLLSVHILSRVYSVYLYTHCDLPGIGGTQLSSRGIRVSGGHLRGQGWHGCSIVEMFPEAWFCEEDHYPRSWLSPIIWVEGLSTTDW